MSARARARILNLVRRIMIANCMSGTCTKFRIRYRTSTLKYLTYTVKHYLIACTKCRGEWLGTVIKLARRSQETQYLAKLKSRAPRRRRGALDLSFARYCVITDFHSFWNFEHSAANTSKWDIVRNFVLLGLFGFEMFEILWVLELLTGAPYWDSE